VVLCIAFKVDSTHGIPRLLHVIATHVPIDSCDQPLLWLYQ
jgi:hypothetical protein